MYYTELLMEKFEQINDKVVETLLRCAYRHIYI